MNILKACLKWHWHTGALIGQPILLMLLLIGTQRLFFTTTCNVIGWKCEYAFGATDAMTSYMGELVAGNEGRDLLSVPKHK